jgi:phosphatidylglycerol:prolipoprotein diacylglycerol transferase
MLPELLRIPLPFAPDFALRSYGLMVAIGFLLAVPLARALARRRGLDPELFVNAGLIALISGLVGARLSHVLENLGQYTDPTRSVLANLGDAVNITGGGLTFYGGLLLAFPVTLYYGCAKRAPLRVGMDIIAPCVMIGLAFGRVGCFLNGCCHGAQCDLPWAVTFPYYSNAYLDHVDHKEIAAPPQLRTARGALLTPRQAAEMPQTAALAAGQRSLPVHPAQLYSALNALLIAGVLLAYFTLAPPAGRVLALMLVLKGVSRYLLETLRTEPAVLGRGTGHLAWLPPHSYSMVLSVILVAGGIVLWLAFGFVAAREHQGDAV